jgi:GT2 family glycosyltransferase
MFLDDDAEVTEDSLAVCIDALSRDQRIGIVCGNTYIRANSNILMSTGIRVRLAAASVYDIGSGEVDRGQYDESRIVDACGGFAFVIRRSLFGQLRGFDEAFSPYGWEEVDLCLRASKLGFRTGYLPTALFSHKGTRQGRPSLPSYEFNKARNFIALLKRHANLGEQVSCAAWIPVRASRLLWKFAQRGEASLILMHVRGALRGLWRRQDS